MVFLRVCRYASDFLPNTGVFFSLGLLGNFKFKETGTWALCYHNVVLFVHSQF